MLRIADSIEKCALDSGLLAEEAIEEFEPVHQNECGHGLNKMLTKLMERGLINKNKSRGKSQQQETP